MNVNNIKTKEKIKRLKERNLKRRKVFIVTIIIAILILGTIIFKPQNYVLRKIYKLEYSEYVYKYSEQNNLDPYLVFSIIKNESKFNRNIESQSGAIGLMQLMEETAIEMANEIGQEVVTKEALYNPDTNIKIGTKYFAYLLKHYKENTGLAIAAYNAGMGNVDSWIKNGIIKEDGSDLENIPYKETNNHVRKILRDYEIYKNIWQ